MPTVQRATSPAATILLILITILIPPVGVFAVSGCSCELLLNILLTVLGYLPGHIHAFYVEYQYFKRSEEGYIAVETDGSRGYGTV